MVAEVYAVVAQAIANDASVTDWLAVEEVVNDTLGRLDSVVSNAGIVTLPHALLLSEEEFDAVIGVRLAETLVLSQHVCSYRRVAAWKGGS
jgi:NAD(P)-dependent dehydrogenase (short-subunit alcohol dehydrogenase family)